MNRRPRSITIIGGFFIAVGVITIILAFLPVHSPAATRGTRIEAQPTWEFALMLFTRVLAIVIGLYLLRGRNWARWLAVAWVAFHVIIGAFHAPSSLLVHGLMLAGLAYFLFRPQVAGYFQRPWGVPSVGKSDCDQ